MLCTPVEQCEVGADCTNSIERAGTRSRCIQCRLAPNNYQDSRGGLLPNYWRPVHPGQKHPLVAAEKKAASIARVAEQRQRRRERDPARRRVQREAQRAEGRTEASFRNTRNSGRVFQDGDHVAADRITLDTKNQPERIHPVVRLEELEKVREDARRSGQILGALVLRPRGGTGIVAMTESDFALLLSVLEKTS